ncbi:MAG TPA: pantoate--beta-alanine ligase [Candidatus Baltobacteraceae bacterium]|jgi:pantoate--beta-alanine ligase|nr:pantoate--beta-alanine ligase [Candidatus Baltobacteraceae bacterium]
MDIVETVSSARAAAAALPRPLALVPTMGALHEGHLRLVQAAHSSARSLAVSIFVNPMQFAPNEDLERYPRDPQRDAAQLQGAGVDLLFLPAPEVMYPPGFSTIVDVGDLGCVYEGAARPTHFRGVATIVSKLLHIVTPDILVLGQKDAQQTAVLRKLVRDLDFPVRVHVEPTVREADGLARSSRNAYLTHEERAAAPSLHAALQRMLQELESGAQAVHARESALPVLHPLGTWEYLDIVDAQTFAPLQFVRPPAFVIGAARFGRTRLIDNLWIPANQ